MNEMMKFPKRWEDFLHDYEFEDARRIYTNGSRLIPSFRVKQMIGHYFPSADVAPVVHGRWEQCFEDWRQQIEGDKCSVCGFEHYGASIKKYKYCPNCGTLMDLEG